MARGDSDRCIGARVVVRRGDAGPPFRLAAIAISAAGVDGLRISYGGVISSSPASPTCIGYHGHRLSVRPREGFERKSEVVVAGSGRSCRVGSRACGQPFDYFANEGSESRVCRPGAVNQKSP